MAKISNVDFENAVDKTQYFVLPDQRTTICMMTLCNGFTVTGSSSCMDIAAFVASEGEKAAHMHAKDKVFEYLAAILTDRTSSTPVTFACDADNALTPNGIGWAVQQMRKGKKVARLGWNGSGMFAYIVPAATYKANTEAAQSHFGDEVPYREYMALKTAQNDVAAWTPSVSDVLATDWVLVR